MMDQSLQQECKRAVYSQQLTSKINEVTELQEQLKEQERQHEELLYKTEEVEKELKCVKEDLNYEQLPSKQQAPFAMRKEEQASDETRRLLVELEARTGELHSMREKHRQLQVQVAMEHQMLEEAKRNEEKAREYAAEQERMHLESQTQQQILTQNMKGLQQRLQDMSARAAEQERLLLDSQRRQQGLENGLQYLRSRNEELQSEATAIRQQMDNERRLYAAEQERLRLEYENLHQRFQRETQTLQQRLESALADLEKRPVPSSHPVNIDPWNVPREDVSVSQEIGRGGWGEVRLGTFGGRTVAVKIPHQTLLNERLLERLKRETRLMIQVHHPNLIRIIGVVFDEAANQLRLPPLIITELLDLNLRSCYEQGRLEVASRLPTFLDVAYSLHYLHNRQEPIIHRDVSAPNVLLKALPNGMWRV